MYAAAGRRCAMNEILRLKLLAEREYRLAKLLHMSAPHVIVADECLLVIRAYAGGTRWDSLRFVLRDIVMDWHVGLIHRLEVLACRVLGQHTWGAVLDEELDETGMEECCYCETRRAAP